MFKKNYLIIALMGLSVVTGIFISEPGWAQFNEIPVTWDFWIFDYHPTIDTDVAGNPHVSWVRADTMALWYGIGAYGEIWYCPGSPYFAHTLVFRDANVDFWYNNNPSINMDKNKNARIVWEHTDDYNEYYSNYLTGPFDILYSDNATFPFPNTPTLIGRGVEPSISVDDVNNSHIVWDNNGNILYTNGFVPPFSAPQAISNPALRNSHPTINTRATSVYVAWDADSAGTTYIWYTTNKTGSFVRQIVTPGSQPSIFVDSKHNAHIAYIDPGGGISYINNIAGGWSTPIQLDVTGAYPHIMIDIYDNAHVTYYKPHAVYYTSNVNGLFIRPTLLVSNEAMLAIVDRAIIDPSGKIYITYWKEAFEEYPYQNPYNDVYVSDLDKPTGWFYKSGYEDYCPFGIPDFDQKQHNWRNLDPGINIDSVWTFDGPAALANCLWWWDSRLEAEGIDTTLVDPYGPWDDHDTSNVRPLIEDFAKIFDTDTILNSSKIKLGTEIHDIRTGVNSLLMDKGLDTVLYVHTDTIPEWETVVYELKRCQNVILLLGFYDWNEIEDSSGNKEWKWCRAGGHYVTLAGIFGEDSVAISDPYLDHEEGDIGIPPTPHQANIHNDAAKISGPHGTNRHDPYEIKLTPGHLVANWALTDYPLSTPMLTNFAGQNVPDWLSPDVVQCPGNVAAEVFVEYALFICPFDSLMGSIRGEKWKTTSDTVKIGDAPDFDIAGWTIVLETTINSKKFRDVVKTDKLGRFLFGGLQPGTYYITEVIDRNNVVQNIYVPNPIIIGPGEHRTGLVLGNNFVGVKTEEKFGLPGNFKLNQNYPNPFNPVTKISYRIPKESQVTLKVYNLLGSEVATLVNKKQGQGVYNVTIDASKWSSGVYFYRIEAGGFTAVRKMVFMR